MSLQIAALASSCPGSIEQPADKTIYREVMRGDWNKVVQIYRCLSPDSHGTKLTHTGDTALHIAVIEGDPQVVKDLLGVLASVRKDGHVQDVLNQRNERMDTPLHVAAGLGMAEVCWLLAAACPELVTQARNAMGETPLFVGVNNGKMKVFFVLQRAIEADAQLKNKQLSETEVISYCRRQKDGSNILHRAIYGEYFELAFEIIHKFPNLVNSMNENGESPLHLLATKPSAFKSGSRIRFLDRLIYAGIIVDPLKPKHPTYYKDSTKLVLKGIKAKKHNKSELSKSYRVCLDAKSILFHIFKVAGGQFLSHGKEKRSYIVKDVKGGNLDSVELNKNEGQDDEPTVLEKQTDQFPPNYVVCYNFLKVALKFMLVVLGIGIRRIEKIRRKKHRYHHANQLMNELITKASFWQYDEDGRNPKTDPQISNMPNYKFQILGLVPKKEEPKKETPILLAAKMGIIELVKRILDAFPIAVYDLDKDNKNVILLAAEYRQPHIFKYMMERQKDKKSIFGMVDKQGNSASHLAAKMSDQVRPWDIPGEALQMHWEIKWYKYIKNSMELNFYPPCNIMGESAKTIFNNDHKKLVDSASEWLRETSNACSVVSTLIATVALTSAVTVPGGPRPDGLPILEGQRPFTFFAVSAILALCFSVSSLVTFLAIITSRFQVKDFEARLPVKLIIGLTALFASIGAMLVSFAGGHYYDLEDKIKYAAYPIYAVFWIPVLLFAFAQFPLYFDLAKATFTHVPERSFRGGAI